MSKLKSKTEIAVSLLKKKDERALGLLEGLFKENSDAFFQELSVVIDTKKLGFDECGSLALAFRELGKVHISIEIYKFLIQKEETLETMIKRERHPEKRRKLMAFSDAMGFSLGRDYNNLGISYVDTKNKDKAKEMILKAYNEDVKHHKFHEAALMPAYRNLALILFWEALGYRTHEEHLPSFLIAWLSVEFSLMRLWFQVLVEKGYSDRKIKRLSRMDIGIIIESLYLLNKIDDQIKRDIDTFKARRNKIFHATGTIPTSGETMRLIHLAQRLQMKN